MVNVIVMGPIINRKISASMVDVEISPYITICGNYSNFYRSNLLEIKFTYMQFVVKKSIDEIIERYDVVFPKIKKNYVGFNDIFRFNQKGIKEIILDEESARICFKKKKLYISGIAIKKEIKDVFINQKLLQCFPENIREVIERKKNSCACSKYGIIEDKHHIQLIQQYFVSKGE